MCIVNSFTFVFAQSERDTKVGLKLERTVGLVELDPERAIGGLFANRHLPQAPVPVILGYAMVVEINGISSGADSDEGRHEYRSGWGVGFVLHVELRDQGSVGGVQVKSRTRSGAYGEKWAVSSEIP